MAESHTDAFELKNHTQTIPVINSLKCVLCILTSEWVLHTPLSGRNQFFDAKTTFYVLFSYKMYKMTQKITKNICFCAALLSFFFIFFHYKWKKLF